MADDKKNEDEYQLGDADLGGGDFLSAPEDEQAEEAPPLSETASAQAARHGKPGAGGLPIAQRNALIVAALFFSVFMIYKLVSYFSAPGLEDLKAKEAAKKAAESTLSTPVKPALSAQAPVPVQEKIEPATELTSTEVPAPTLNSAPEGAIPENRPMPTETSSATGLDQKVSTVLSIDQKLQTDVNGLSSQLTTLQTSLQTLTEKVSTLTNLIESLKTRVDEQTNAMHLLEAKLMKLMKPIRQYAGPFVPRRELVVQAVIPGRAWLITREGTDSVTVREGSDLEGYGVVQWIDPQRGRVLTSSGRVITFPRQEN